MEMFSSMTQCISSVEGVPLCLIIYLIHHDGRADRDLFMVFFVIWGLVFCVALQSFRCTVYRRIQGGATDLGLVFVYNDEDSYGDITFEVLLLI